MRNKKIILCFLIFILMVSVGLGALYVKDMMVYTYKTVNIDDYGITLKYPRAYEEVEKEKDSSLEQISSQIQAAVDEYEKSGDKLIEFTKELIDVKSEVSGITLLVEGIKKEEKTKKTIEQICKDYKVMFQVYNPNAVIKSSEYKEISIDGKNAGRVEIYIENQKSTSLPGLIAYLIPLDDREITITFMGTDKLFKNAENEIKKITESIKLK